MVLTCLVNSVQMYEVLSTSGIAISFLQNYCGYLPRMKSFIITELLEYLFFFEELVILQYSDLFQL